MCCIPARRSSYPTLSISTDLACQRGPEKKNIKLPESESRHNTHDENKRTWYATEEHQKSTIGAIVQWYASMHCFCSFTQFYSQEVRHLSLAYSDLRRARSLSTAEVRTFVPVPALTSLSGSSPPKKRNMEPLGSREGLVWYFERSNRATEANNLILDAKNHL